MTDFLSRRHAPSFDGRVLARGVWGEALRLAQRDPVSYLLAITHIERGIRDGVEAGEIWAFPATGPIEAACWVGANLVPIIPDAQDNPALVKEALAVFANMAMFSPRRSSSMVGPRELVMPLWEQLSGQWTRPREIRESQPSMVLTEPSQIEPDPHVRVAQIDEFDLVFPASVHMFIEEVGVSPLSFGSAQYALRVRELIELERTVVRMGSTVGDEYLANDMFRDRETVAFKTDFGAVASGVAQAQGVWVNPVFRGQGLAAPAMAAAANYALEQLAPTVSLYVNDYNLRALATYRRVGFTQVGEYSTILY